MDILSRQRRTRKNINPEFRFAIKFWEIYYRAGVMSEEMRTVEILARTKKKALNYFRKHYPGDTGDIIKVYSPKERKRYAPNIQETFAREEAKRITDEVFGSPNAS